MVGHAEIEVKVHKLAHRVPLAWSDLSHGERQQPTFYSPPFTIPGHSGPQLRTQGAQQRADRVKRAVFAVAWVARKKYLI